MDGPANDRKLRPATRANLAGRPALRRHGMVNPPVERGSTVLYPSCDEKLAHGHEGIERDLQYGLNGNATHWALEDLVAEVEGGTRCQIVPTGLAAATVALMAFLSAGDHCLVPDSVYGPTRTFCDGLGTRLGFRTTYYPPCDTEAVRRLIEPRTRVVFAESPGSHTFELQDVPALAEIAHGAGARLVMDNTWGIQVFQPFAHGVDVSVQALTKYVAGHSDVMLGAVTVASDETWAPVRRTALELGLYASPDDCWLALRGARTLGVRLAHQERSALEVARWLASRPEVATVRYPALPGAPGHELWRRDYDGATSLFGVELHPRYTVAQLKRMIDGLSLFGIGASWGGFESLALLSSGYVSRTAGRPPFEGPAFRLHIGLEDTADLIADLQAGLESLG